MHGPVIFEAKSDFDTLLYPPPCTLLTFALFFRGLQFSNKDEADRCLAAAIGATDPTFARDSGGSCIYLGTRALHVTRAVDREQVMVGPCIVFFGVDLKLDLF